MSLIEKKLRKMNVSSLKKVCKKIGLSYRQKKKENIIQTLLNPLKYKMKSRTVNEQILYDLNKYREQKRKTLEKQKKSIIRGTNIKQQCKNQIENVINIRNSIQRDIYLNKPITALRKKTLKYRNKQLIDCLQKKQSNYSTP